MWTYTATRRTTVHRRVELAREAQRGPFLSKIMQLQNTKGLADTSNRRLKFNQFEKVKSPSALIQIEIADGLSGGSVLGLLHGLFKFLRENVFFVGLLEKRVSELVFTLTLLLGEDVVGFFQVDVGASLWWSFVGKHCPKDGINHQLGLAARAGHVQVF